MVSLIAEYPLGTYSGIDQYGHLEAVPSIDRLSTALLAAAGAGSHALSEGGVLAPRPEDVALLEWLEANPPDGIVLPRTALITEAGAIAYRKQGLRQKSDVPKGGPALRRAALSGPITWYWREMPDDVRRTLSELIPEVPYLGPADSPVVLSLTSEAPDPASTLWRDDKADPFTSSGREIQVASPGRTRALIDAYAKRQNIPTARQDQLKANEEPVVDPWLRSHLNTQLYRRDEPEAVTRPWPGCLVVQVQMRRGQSPRPQDRVRFCVALHRAIVGILGMNGVDVDAWITGRFLPGVVRPANRVAIHYMPRTEATRIDWLPEVDGAFLVMLPDGLPGAVRGQVEHAVERLQQRGLNITRRETAMVTRSNTIAGDQFWVEPRSGVSRLWFPAPVSVAERSSRQGTLADAFRLSLGMVWRDSPMRKQVESVKVLRAHRVLEQDLKKYVHKMNPEAQLLVYRAIADLGSLMGDGDLIAIGQSRHLGGGLLVPVDVPQDSVEALP